MVASIILLGRKGSSTMAEGHLAAADAQEEDEIFVYMGGHQEVPYGIRRARIHKSVKTIPARAFQRLRSLISVEFHDEIEIIEEYAFLGCWCLRGSIKLLGIQIIKGTAFSSSDIEDVELGSKLDTIEGEAFYNCQLLRTITMPSVRTIGKYAFCNCKQLTDLKLPEELEAIGKGAFDNCVSLRRITLPLKDDMIADDVFDDCPNLTAVDLVEGIHKTVSSLHLESWRNGMTGEINHINQDLPNTDAEQKTQVIREWMSQVIIRLDHYKAEHHKLLKEATTLLELALWKANLDNNKGGALEREGVRTRRQLKRARKEISVTSGASIVIKNVLPFLELN